MRYQGSKYHFISKFNELTRDLKSNIYIEPFLGSGAILFNLSKKYDKYIINDSNKHIISIYNSIKVIDYQYLIETKNYIYENFGDIKNSKHSYYQLRDFYNKEFHNTDSVDKGVYLYFLANSCINSMLRFGPHGMNQSFGNRLYYMDAKTFNHCKEVLSRCEIMNTDYLDSINNVGSDLNKSLIFLDPPYFERPTSYETNFNENDHIKFLNYISQISSNILYTDIYSDFIKDTLNWSYVKSKVITNTTPGKKSNKFQEVCFYNFNVKKNTLF